MVEIISEKLPFGFGIDQETGEYGYIKVGADTVTPFKVGYTLEEYAGKVKTKMYNSTWNADSGNGGRIGSTYTYGGASFSFGDLPKVEKDQIVVIVTRSVQQTSGHGSGVSMSVQLQRAPDLQWESFTSFGTAITIPVTSAFRSYTHHTQGNYNGIGAAAHGTFSLNISVLYFEPEE